MTLRADTESFAGELLSAARSDPEATLRDKIALLTVLARLVGKGDDGAAATGPGLEYFRGKEERNAANGSASKR